MQARHALAPLEGKLTDEQWSGLSLHSVVRSALKP